MADYGTIFLLILAALSIVIVGMFFIVYLMILGEREKNRLRAKMESFTKKEKTQGCPHSFGYLAGYPENQSIPEECFGCPQAVECVNAQKDTENKTITAEPPKTATASR